MRVRRVQLLRRRVSNAIGGVVADAAQPVFTFVGGGAAVGASLFCTFAFSFAEEPQYGRVAGQGSVAGGCAGAALLLIDTLVGG